jgi:hypothetical protein
MIADGDIRGGQVGHWLLVGWFTPNYRPLAQRFAADLEQHGTPFRLFAKPALGTWSTSRKPSVVIEAMDLYPGKTIVLADVDCIIQGDVAPVADVAGDVGICVIAKNVVKGETIRPWLSVETSSRVVVFKPTDGARTFAQRWAAEIERSSTKHDEHALSWAYLRSQDVRFEFIDQAYSGREISIYPDAVIAHDSAHEKQRRDDMSVLKRVLRRIEKPFRTGRTKASKMQGELSSVLKA